MPPASVVSTAGCIEPCIVVQYTGTPATGSPSRVTRARKSWPSGVPATPTCWSLLPSGAFSITRSPAAGAWRSPPPHAPSPASAPASAAASAAVGTMVLASTTEPRFELFPIAAAHPEPLAGAEHHHPVAREPRLDLRHPIEVDQRGPMDPREARGIQPALERGERLPQHVHGLARVQPHVVAGRLDPVDLGRR